jgi:acetyl-CoA carboxylase carboxyltransferase component
LAGSYLVKAAIGETIDNETLGGSVSQTDLSGVIDDRFPDDKSCLDRIRFLVDKIGDSTKAGFSRTEPVKPNHETNDIFGILPSERSKPYKSIDLIKRLVDNSEFEQYKANYGKTILCGYARIDGWAVGIVANNREIIKNKKGEMQFGGVIYSDSADKAARFIMNCNQKKIPLVFLQDVTGFMVGSRSEHGGIIKDGAKMVNAMSNSTVPKFTIVMGNSYGAGNYAMCGKAYDPRLIVAWPSAKIAVMGGEQAAKVLLQIEKASLSKKGEEISLEKETELLENIINRYNTQTTPEYAASRLWVDEIINPLDTRKWISTGIEMANNAPIEKYNVGVIQT